MEWVGKCTVCTKDVYCRDGFLDGVVAGHPGVLYCHDCYEKHGGHAGDAGVPDSHGPEGLGPKDH
ncbi:MAG: hypothetical protein K0R75_4086 [Paenibacillaceae bacterium]|jgi:hypothetical protein|nr:hypothetical protein [Paenibacillaceae bacterium]